MKSAIKFLSLVALALVANVLATPARADDYPSQFAIEARQIGKPAHYLNCARTEAWPEEAKIDTVIHFENASSKLTPTAKAEVKKVAMWLKKPAFKGKHVTVNGYTDSKGKTAGNQRLSYHRALTVMHALVADGVPASMLSAQGFGKDSPVADNATAAGRAMNRRVTFTVTSPAGM